VIKSQVPHGAHQHPEAQCSPLNLLDNRQAPELPKWPMTVAEAVALTTPPATLTLDAAMICEQAAMLKEYEDKQCGCAGLQPAADGDACYGTEYL